MDPPWAAPAVATLHDLYELSAADPRRSSVVYSRLSQAASDAPAPWTLVRHAPVQSNSGDAPCRSVTALRQHLEGEGALLPFASALSEAVPTASPAVAPLFVMTAPN